MKNFKKKLCLVLGLIVALSSFAGCGDKKSSSSNGEVDLVWMMPGSEQADSKIVWEKYNEELKKKPGFENYSVDFTLVPFADFAQKFMLFQTSGEQIDIVATYNVGYSGEVRDGTFLDITDMMEEHAPDILKEIPEWALKLCQVDNRQYAITNYQQMASPKYGTTLQADEAAKYFDFEAFEKAQASSPKLSEAMYDVYEDYLTKLKENGELHLGMYPGTTWGMMKGYDAVEGYRWVFERAGDGVKVEHYMETDTYKLLIKKADEFFKKGFIRKDVLSAELGKETGLPNGYDIWHSQCFDGAEEALAVKYGMEVKIIEPEEGFFIQHTSNSGGNAILASTDYPEEALKFLNMMYTEKGKDMYRLLTYGIEGKHYTRVEGSDVRIEPIGYVGSPGAADAPYGLNEWIVGNSALSFETPNRSEGWNDYVFNEWNPSATQSKIAGFNLNKEDFEAEAAQIATITGEYLDQLASGSLPNYEATYEEAMNKLEIAGLDKVRAAIQEQVDAHLASQK